MNVGMIVDNEFTGDLRVQNEVLALLRGGYNVFVLCLNHSSYEKISSFNGATIIRLTLPKFFKNKLKFIGNSILDLYSLWWAYQISKFVREFEIGLLHAHDLYMARPVILANKKFNLPTILDLHENYPMAVKSYSWANSFLGKIFVSHKRWQKREKKYLSHFDKIIVLSNDFKNTLQRKYNYLNEDQLIVFPNYPNIEEWVNYKSNEETFAKGNSFIIFYFGVIGVRRGIFTLIDSLKSMINEYPNIKLLLIGPVDRADEIHFMEQINDNKVKKNIIYYKWKDVNLIPAYLKLSDICVSPIFKNPQHESGIANKVFQYMLFEKPLIVSNCIPQQRVVEEENCGLIFNSNDPEDLSAKIKILYKNEELRKSMGKNGKNAVLQKYNLAVSSKNLVDNYRLING